MILCRNELIDEHHKSKGVVTQREVNPKQIVPQIKEEKEQVIDTLHYYRGTKFIPYMYIRLVKCFFEYTCDIIKIKALSPIQQCFLLTHAL